MENRKIEYTIVGTHKTYGDCLICLAGSDRGEAEIILEAITTSPTYRKAYKLDDFTNIKINEECSDECWWNYGTN